MSSTASLGDVRFGVGQYKDPASDAFGYQLGSNINAGATAALNQAAAQTALNALSAAGGGDTPEGNLLGLQQVANTTAWRAGSARIAVWFGDAPGHDPSGGATETSAKAALNANNVKVQAISLTSGPGLDAACGGATDCTAGQGTRIATATGGSLVSGINTAGVVAAINAAISSAISNYSSVCLTPVGNLPSVDVSTTACITGAFDRTIDRTFGFDVTFHDLLAGAHIFSINATVDGSVVATESDTITGTGGGTTPPPPTTVPEPGSLVLLAMGLFGLVGARKFSIR
jgi:hypothetical protein